MLLARGISQKARSSEQRIEQLLSEGQALIKWRDRDYISAQQKFERALRHVATTKVVRSTDPKTRRSVLHNALADLSIRIADLWAKAEVQSEFTQSSRAAHLFYAAEVVIDPVRKKELLLKTADAYYEVKSNTAELRLKLKEAAEIYEGLAEKAESPEETNALLERAKEMHLERVRQILRNSGITDPLDGAINDAVNGEDRAQIETFAKWLRAI